MFLSEKSKTAYSYKIIDVLWYGFRSAENKELTPTDFKSLLGSFYYVR